MDERARDRPAVLIAVLLLAVGLLAASLATAWAIHQHRADEAALHRDPSYRYGNNLSVFGPPFNHSTDSPRAACTDYLQAHPAKFPGFSVEKAVRGCVDEWYAATG